MFLSIDLWKEYEARYAKEDKAKQLSEPKEPAKRLPVRATRYTVKRHGLLYQERIRADAAGGDDHAHAAHCQDGKGVYDGEMAGLADGKKAHPGAEQV